MSQLRYISKQQHLHHRLCSVPVIVVFTKIDRLQFREQKRLKKIYIEGGMEAKLALAQAKINCVAEAAAEYKKSCLDVLRSDLVPAAWSKCCAVSNKREPILFVGLTSLLIYIKSMLDPDYITQLIEITKSTLVQSEALNILWASVQMVLQHSDNFILLPLTELIPRLTLTLKSRCLSSTQLVSSYLTALMINLGLGLLRFLSVALQSWEEQ